MIATVVDQNGEEKKRTKKFKLVRRELKSNEDEPMQGSDVAMLEELLWQLGISPQLGKPGSEGARIGSVRYLISVTLL